jgi:hypothetical protein
MRFFAELVELVEDRWRARDYGAAAFPGIAAGALEEACPAEHVSPEDIVQWVLRTPHLGLQMNLGSKFGQPALCVASASHVFIEALFWLDATTSVHQHSFSGAFHVLHGSSIHARYGFQAREPVSGHLLLGEVLFKEAELLGKGQTRAIPPGSEFIHALFHLERPSVSIVVRTYNDWYVGPQYSYLKPSIAFNPFYKNPETVRRLEVLNLLHDLRDPQHLARARDLAADSDFGTAWEVIYHCFERRVSEAHLAELVEGLGRRHGQRAQLLQPVLEELERQRYIIERRRVLTEPEHRFFLALLLNLPSRQTVVGLVRDAFPGKDPAEVILRWVREISKIAGQKELGPNPLGIQFSDSELFVFGCLLQGCSDQVVIERLAAEYDEVGGQEAEIGALCQAFRTSRLFRPLFAA